MWLLKTKMATRQQRQRRNDGNNNNGNNGNGNNRNNQGGRPDPCEQRKRAGKDRNRKAKEVKAEVTEEDVAKQVKETLARLTNKQKGNKGAKVP